MTEEATLYYEGVGRRKTSSARVRVYPQGDGSFLVNDVPVERYFPRVGDVDHLMAPLSLVEELGAVNVTVHVQGGGQTGQSGAIRHGLARALAKLNSDYRPALREAGYLTRDARMKERKKPGLKKARKAPTYTKR
jgi:small subunit ribosomal protein S9